MNSDPPPNVHDNWVYAQVIDCQHRRIILHTYFPHANPPEFTDVIFEGVVTHHFQEQQFNAGEYPGTVLFDIEEADPQFVLEQYEDLLKRTKNYGWPVSKYDGLSDLITQLTTNGAKCFDISSSCGLTGFVFATIMLFRSRPSQAVVGDIVT